MWRSTARTAGTDTSPALIGGKEGAACPTVTVAELREVFLGTSLHHRGCGQTAPGRMHHQQDSPDVLWETRQDV